MSNVRTPVVLDLFAPGPRWRFDGDTCAERGKGAVRVVLLGSRCACKAARAPSVLCPCLAEGYAACEACGALRQVFPADVVEA